ncbi:MAG: hypothetical protein E6I18_07480 [Chloroflexi bacterium]|nr:MAG: hypothetical protein E6I18_07480 [Chloroflexota bacterium]
MDEHDYVLRNDLDEAIVETSLGDCRLAFRRQRRSGDLWCVVGGPLAVIAVPLIPAGILEQVRDHRDPTDPLARRARGRYAKWQQVRVDDDLLIAIRGRASDLQWHFLFGDGTPFGGGGSWLPTARRASLLDRLRLWLSGRRGSHVAFLRETNAKEIR